MKVFLSPLAEWKIERLLEYLELEWSKKSRDKYLETLLKSFSQISKQPKSCPESEGFPNLYKRVVTKQSSFFYRIVEDKIEVIDLIDNRQNPDTIQAEIEKYFG